MPHAARPLLVLLAATVLLLAVPGPGGLADPSLEGRVARLEQEAAESRAHLAALGSALGSLRAEVEAVRTRTAELEGWVGSAREAFAALAPPGETAPAAPVEGVRVVDGRVLRFQVVRIGAEEHLEFVVLGSVKGLERAARLTLDVHLHALDGRRMKSFRHVTEIVRPGAGVRVEGSLRLSERPNEDHWARTAVVRETAVQFEVVAVTPLGALPR